MEQSGVQWKSLQKLNNFIYTSVAFPSASVINPSKTKYLKI